MNNTDFAEESSPRCPSTILVAAVYIGIYEPTEVIVQGPLGRPSTGRQRTLPYPIDVQGDRRRAVVCNDVLSHRMHYDGWQSYKKQRGESEHHSERCGETYRMNWEENVVEPCLEFYAPIQARPGGQNSPPREVVVEERLTVHVGWLSSSFEPSPGTCQAKARCIHGD
jgi:hypothetical protein